MADFCELGRRDVHIAHAPVGEDGHGDVVPGLGVKRERAGAKDFDVVGMGSNGENVHGRRGVTDWWIHGFMDSWIGGSESFQSPAQRLDSIDLMRARSLFSTS
jgi:hypothetical protein